MKTIWKVNFQIADVAYFKAPPDAEMLSVQMQRNEAMLWFLCSPHLGSVTHTIRVFGTGQPVPDNDCLKYIGTVQTHGGQLVWHIFKDTYPHPMSEHIPLKG